MKTKISFVILSHNDAEMVVGAVNSIKKIKTKHRYDVYVVDNGSKDNTPEEVKKMLHQAIEGDFMEARKSLDSLMYQYSLSAEDILMQIHREVVGSDDYADRAKLQLIDKIGEVNFRVTEGANERIQLEAFLAQLVLMRKKK